MLLFLLGTLLVLTAGDRRETTEGMAVELAKQAVATEAGVSAATVMLRGVEASEWPDAGLGCTKADGIHPRRVVPGHRVLLQARGGLYRVHVGAGRAVICGASSKRDPRATPRKPPPERVPEREKDSVTGEVPGEVLDPILDDLATRVDAERSEVRVLRAEAVVFSDGSLGCPEPGQVYTQATVEGYRVVLGYGDREYDYRAGRRGFFVLCDRPSAPFPRGAGPGPVR